MGLRRIEHDTIELMKWLSKKANIEWAQIQRMVLVLDIDDIPRLYVKQLLCEDEESTPPPGVPIETEKVEGIEIDADKCEVVILNRD